MTCRLPFQGPDIDPYLRLVLEVDVAELMSELGGVLGGPSVSEATAQAGTSAQTRGLSEKLEDFYVEG
jgi:hypothetical protein